LIGSRPIILTTTFGGVPDSISDWSALLPFESEMSLVNPRFKKSNGNYEEMPLAA
jgi:hypothetical protein